MSPLDEPLALPAEEEDDTDALLCPLLLLSGDEEADDFAVPEAAVSAEKKVRFVRSESTVDGPGAG